MGDIGDITGKWATRESDMCFEFAESGEAFYKDDGMASWTGTYQTQNGSLNFTVNGSGIEKRTYTYRFSDTTNDILYIDFGSGYVRFLRVDSDIWGK